MKSRTNIFLVVMLLLLIGVAQADPTAYNGVVTVDTVTTSVGNQVNVAVRLKNNNASISYMFFPMKYTYPGLRFDSVSFVGSMMPSNFSGDYSFDAGTGVIRIAYLPEFSSPLPTISTASGILFKIHFTVLGSANPGTAVVDSINQDSLLAGGITK